MNRASVIRGRDGETLARSPAYAPAPRLERRCWPAYPPPRGAAPPGAPPAPGGVARDAAAATRVRLSARAKSRESSLHSGAQNPRQRLPQPASPPPGLAPARVREPRKAGAVVNNVRTTCRQPAGARLPPLAGRRCRATPTHSPKRCVSGLAWAHGWLWRGVSAEPRTLAAAASRATPPGAGGARRCSTARWRVGGPAAALERRRGRVGGRAG